MGLYQESLSKQEVIRDYELDDHENKVARQPTFGNPYRKLGNSRSNSPQNSDDETTEEAAFGFGRSPSKSSSPRKRPLSPGRPSPEGPKRPVSYTHLRAHETPEHLVCRLLLEKKKKYST
eukprot:TRINITY_DN52187_c0_g1_i1.p2 TRINITY_DN52187_c0_g1~~TRINITY_DN52187_c0_g1_i1.p2  ORF type:complete len:120 (-),score=32.93 TRINITY_DN52187_c0_g1_i1:2-361(-)